MYIDYDKRSDISAILGQTIVRISGLDDGSEEVIFETDDGRQFGMHHDQDCCESVLINDVEGDIRDLIGLPLLVAEEVDSSSFPAPPGDYVESYTWTFYRLATQKGYVVVRWLGESNGYYSESVTFGQIN